ncbi:hypothetical protein TUE45_06484 [Streptomyces reticuli]|nr:hypothetical protein TUE45_06484 [Streptomyces reticuli]
MNETVTIPHWMVAANAVLWLITFVCWVIVLAN